MQASIQSTVTEIADGDPRLRAIDSLLTRGYMLQALRAAETCGPLETYRGARARVIAAWLVDHLGGDELARRWYAGSFRAAPRHPSVRLFYTYLVLRERGPVEAFRVLHDYVAPEEATPAERAELASLRARILALLLDHRMADKALAECERDAVGHDRFAACEATLLQQRGEKKQALAVIERELIAMPFSRVLVQHAVALLEAQDRRADALALLERVEPELEMPLLTLQRAGVEHELLLFDAELASIQRAERMLLRAGRATGRRLALARAENAYRRGDFRSAASHARQSGSSWWAKFAPRLELLSGVPERRELSVPVVLQEPMSCAPASLAMLSGYFGRPVDHVDVADQICYEGTASHSERSWAERSGFVSREFTVDFATARALVLRELPFLLVTVEIASAHAQVVIGFDATRRSLIVRDPMTYRIVELDADALFERHRAYGPRGHVLVPADRAELLEGIVLPDVELHDLAHQQRLALERHARAAAESLTAELERRAPGHPLALWAARGVAHYDQDLYALRRVCESALARHPDDVNTQITVLECLDVIGTTSEKRERLERLLAAPDVPWIFHELQARLLAADVTELERARRLARRALRSVPLRGRTLELAARIERDLGELTLSLCLGRAAATLETADDDLARRYFEAALRAGEVESALELLVDRAERFRARSGRPAIVLFEALEWLARIDEAFAALSVAIAKRPTDAELLLFSAEAHARYRRSAEAHALLREARGSASSAAYEQSAARIAETEGRLSDALSRHQAVLATTPLALESLSAVAYLLGELSGPVAARRHLTEVCARYPSHCRLRQLHVEWLRGHDPEHVLQEIDALLALQPAHLWARRERALTLSRYGEHERAIAEAREACELAPRHSSSQRVLSAVLLAAGRRGEALAPALRAVELTPDEPGTIVGALHLSGSLSEQRELLRGLEPKLRRATVDGAGLVEWHGYASGLLDEAELLELARAALAERPALWSSHHLVAMRLLRAGDAGRARELLEAAVQRFPFVPQLFLDVADACRARGDGDGEVAAAQRAVQLQPGWVVGALHASEALVRNRDRDGARHVLERTLAFHPRSAELVRALARLSWDNGDPERAFRESREAVELDPEAQDGWDLHYRFAATLEREADVVALARRITGERPWNAVVWVRLADILRRKSENLASLDALGEALQRRPRWSEALELYATTLARIGRKDEALAACERPTETFFAQGVLKARRAWVRWGFGEKETACADMHRVLREHPDQVWGRMVLIEWESELGHHEVALELARALVELAPLNATTYVYLGDAELVAGRTDNARVAFEQAAALEPSYAYAGSKRLQIALELGRWDDGTRVLDEQGRHVPPEIRSSWEVSLAAARGDSEAAFDAFERLAESPTVTPPALYDAARHLQRLAPRDVARRLRTLSRRAGVNPEVGGIWVTALDNLGLRPSALSIRRLRREHPEAFSTAVRAYFEALGDRSASFLRLVGALVLLGTEARRGDATWGKVGYALTQARAYVLCQLWLADYAKRGGAEAWMLHNYRVAALENHCRTAALRAVEHALTLPADDTLPMHLTFAAFGRAVSGELAGARELAEGRVFHELGERERWLLQATELLGRVSGGPDEQRADALRELELVAGGVFAAIDPFSLGMLRRWLAAGVLRCTFQLGFFLRRWALLSVVVACAVGSPGALVLLLLFYLAVRFYR